MIEWMLVSSDVETAALLFSSYIALTGPICYRYGQIVTLVQMRDWHMERCRAVLTIRSVIREIFH